MHTAKPLVKTIVSEIHTAPSEKSIPTADVGGVAGGSKFVTSRLFIKFATNDISLDLYGGDKWAQKAAGHELKSVNSLLSCSLSNLHFALMCLIDYRGFRFIVTSKLPIGHNTLVCKFILLLGLLMNFICRW